MSAAAVPLPRKKLPICKVPLSYFTRLLQEIEKPSERACFGLVLNETTKPGVKDGYAPITPEEFAAVSNVEKQYVTARVDFLVGAGWVKRRYVQGRPGKGWEYAIQPELATESKAAKITGRCKECKQIGQFTTQFIPVPRSFFTTLAAGLDNDAYLSIAVIARYSHENAWTAEDGLQPKWVTLDLNDFERLTGRDKRSLSNGIAELEKLSLIECDRKPGKATRYRTLPENWGNLAKRGPRLVEQPVERHPKEKAKTAAVEPAEKPANPKEPMQTSRYGFCVKCNHIVEVEPVSEQELLAQQSTTGSEQGKAPPRMVPGRARGVIVDEPLSRVQKWKGIE